jgi:hypothetical protein
MGRERSTTICASNEEEYLNILKQKDSEKHLITISPKRKRSRLSSMIDGMENSPKNNQENFNEENFKLEFLHNEKDNNNNDIDKEEKLKNKEYCSIINCECYCDNLHCSPQENIDRYNDEYEEYSMLKENFKFEVIYFSSFFFIFLIFFLFYFYFFF